MLDSINQFLLNAVQPWRWLHKAPTSLQPARRRGQRALKRAIKSKMEAGSAIFIKLDPAAPDHARRCLQRATLQKNVWIVGEQPDALGCGSPPGAGLQAQSRRKVTPHRMGVRLLPHPILRV